MSKCSFCTTSCGNEHCAYNERKDTLMEVTLDSYQKLEDISRNQKEYIKTLEAKLSKAKKDLKWIINGCGKKECTCQRDTAVLLLKELEE